MSGSKLLGFAGSLELVNSDGEYCFLQYDSLSSSVESVENGNETCLILVSSLVAMMPSALFSL